MFYNTSKLNINPIITTLHIRFASEIKEFPTLISDVYNKLSCYFADESIELADTHFSENNLEKMIVETNHATIRFESKDAQFLSKLSILRFPEQTTISCSVHHINDDNILFYSSLIKPNIVTTLSFSTQPITAEKLRSLMPHKPDLYDKNDFFAEYNSDFNFDELSSKIYTTKDEFIKHEIQIGGTTCPTN